MEEAEEKEWVQLVIRSLKSLDGLEDEQIQKSIQIAQSIREQLKGQFLKPSTVALMIMQLDDLDKPEPAYEFDPAFV
jgi:hypothetical protein